MAETTRSLIGIDIDAVAAAVKTLQEEDVHVTNVEAVERDAEDGMVRWSMTCQAETRTASIDDFE